MSTYFNFDRLSDVHQGLETLFTVQEIKNAIDQLADKLAKWFDEEPIAEVVMNGAFIFAADLVRALSNRGVILEMDFIRLEKDRRAGKVTLIAANDRPVVGREILLIDGIFEHGKTLEYAKKHFEHLGASGITSCVLLDKSDGIETKMKPDFTGFKCPNVFVVGYGLDVGHRYREVPFIARLGQA